MLRVVSGSLSLLSLLSWKMFYVAMVTLSGMIAVNEQFMVMVDYKVLHIFCNII